MSGAQRPGDTDQSLLRRIFVEPQTRERWGLRVSRIRQLYLNAPRQFGIVQR
jgi:hypothetical protein